ncbi:MAG: serine/threonine protein kinase, partial [Bradymonadaceae bacterium]
MSRPRIADQIPLLRIRADGMEERTMSVVDAPDGARDDRALAVLDELAIPGSNPRTDDVERLVEDAATGRLVPSHPNLSATWAAEHDGDHLRVLWHLQPGPPLAPLLESIRSTGEPPSLSRALGLLARLADALEHLHADLDRIHGALAPSTVRLTTGGEPTLDGLGGARLALAYGQTEGRISGRRLAYLSPEHCLDESLDPRSDVFTWGILAWELVTGGTLYGGQDDFERMRAICDESPPAPSSRNDEIPPLLNSLIQKALASDPEDRFDHAGGLREALEQTVLSSTDIANPEDTAAWAADALPQRWSGWANVADHLAAGEDRAAIESVAELYPDAERLEHPTADPDDEEEEATDEPPSSDFDVAVPAPVDEDESETSPPALPDDSDEPTAPDRGAGDVPEEPASESDGSIADDAHRPPPDDPGEALAAMTVEEWLENDEEEPEHHRPPFSTEELLDDQPRHRHEEAERDSGSVLEVVRLVDDRVLDVDVLHRFHRRYAPAGIPFSARLKRRGAVLTAEGELEGVVRRSDGGVDPPPSPGDAVDLQPGDVAELVDGDLRFRIRHLRAIRAPSGEETSGPSIGFYALAAAIALAVHGLATMGIVTLHSQFGV